MAQKGAMAYMGPRWEPGPTRALWGPWHTGPNGHRAGTHGPEGGHGLHGAQMGTMTHKGHMGPMAHRTQWPQGPYGDQGAGIEGCFILFFILSEDLKAVLYF